MWRASLLFILCIFQIYLLSAQEPGHLSKRARHGEHCNKTVRCDTSSYLTCHPISSVCECQQADTMFYDPVIKSCLVLVGERCKYQLVKSTDDSSSEMHHVRNLVLEDELDCVQNGFCNRSGFCMCSGDYIEISNGTCIPKRNLGESCSSDEECRQDQFLVCNTTGNYCSCNETVATYNILIRQCVGKAGKPCLGSSAGCVYNAECIDSSASYLAFTKRRMRQSVKLCGCFPGFIADESGYCRVGFGGQCSNSKTCAHPFQCTDGICKCPYEENQLIRSQDCLSLVGGPCNETIRQPSPSYDIVTENNSSSAAQYQQQIFSCVDNAYCAVSKNNSFYECQCNPGFVVNNDGTCDMGYGAACDSLPYPSDTNDSDPVTWNDGPKCGNSLYCINGACQCSSLLYEYDEDYKSCLGKVGARCRLKKTTEEDINLTGNGCISNAECVPSKYFRVPHGVCSCTIGYTVTTNRTCFKL